MVIDGDAEFLLLLPLLDGLGHEHAGRAFLKRLQFLREEAVEILDRRLRALLFEQSTNRFDFLRNGWTRFWIDEQIRGVAEEEDGENQQRQTPELRKLT